MPYVISVDTASDQEWYYWGNTFYHDHVCTDYYHLPSLHESKIGNKVGILITANGQLHLFLNGKNAATLATGLPVHKSLFGVIHVFDTCSKIKSEILSGKLYSVYTFWQHICMHKTNIYVDVDETIYLASEALSCI